MPTRRSIRVPGPSAQQPVNNDHPSTANAGMKGTKNKASATNTMSKQEAKAIKAMAAGKKGQKSCFRTQSGSAKDKLLSLPPEVLVNLILDKIRDPSTINALCRTCKTLYSLMMPQLYGRITVAARFHAHIPKLIRTIQPHLTIAQQKELNKEGKYRGQRETFPDGIDENARPRCASYVRQIVVGTVNPGYKHKRIVDKYIEEAFKNMDNLEIVETAVLTKSMAHNISSLKNLKAVRLISCGGEAEDMAPLANVEQLKHLNLIDNGLLGGSIDDYKIEQSIIVNSLSTLQSLAVHSNIFHDNFLLDLDSKTSKKDAASNQSPLTALKSLTLFGYHFLESDSKSLERRLGAIDFTRLAQLNLTRFRDANGLLWQYLGRLSTLSEGTQSVISLRSLSFEMSDDISMNTPGQGKEDFEAQCRFIASFSSLTTLDLLSYGEYPAVRANNPGLSSILLQAILKHKNLKTLRIRYKNGAKNNCKIPYLSAKTVEIILSGLPQLQEFEFAPEEDHISSIGEALAKGTNLIKVDCFPHASWGVRCDVSDNPGIRGILQAYLSHATIEGHEKFVWEDHYKLEQFSLAWNLFDIASRFGKGEKGMKKPEKLQSVQFSEYEVFFRDISGTLKSGCYYPDDVWVAKADRDLL